MSKSFKNINYGELSYYRTTVSISKTQNAIRKILDKFGLKGIRFTEYNNNAGIEFILEEDQDELAFRFTFPLPEKEMYQRQVWRGFFHYIKNRFMSIEFGITSIAEEFMQEMVIKLPNYTTTVKELIKEQLPQLVLNSRLELPFKGDED